MSEVSPAGAEAAARYFLSLYSYAFETGDLAELRTLSHPECIFCASLADAVTEQQTSGFRTVGGGLTVAQVEVVEVTPGEWFAIDAVGTQEPWKLLDASGAMTQEEPSPSDHVYHLIVVRESDVWLIREVQVDGETA